MIFPVILVIASLVTHFLFFGYPSAVVFDEVYTGSFVSRYSTGEYYFDVHPPLAKLLEKFFGDMIGASYNVDFSAIGNTLPWGVILLRLLPLLAGVLLPLVIYYICRYLNFSKIASFTAGALVILENSLLVQARFILFDNIMLLFGFLATLLYLIYLCRQSKKSLVILSALLCAGAFSIKWTGLAFPLLIMIAEIVRVKKVKECAKFFAVYAGIGAIFYISIFATHFAYLDRSGPGDAFMTDRFQKTLVGSAHADDTTLKPKGFFGKFIELNVEMLAANKTLTVKHDYSSMWYTWPIMQRPIFYWQEPVVNGVGSYIYFLGNPIIYWLGALSIIGLFFFYRKKVALFIFSGFLVNFLPFIFIGRVMFLYHYEAALIFSIIALIFLIDQGKYKKVIFPVLVCACLISFLYFSPLTYGLPLSNEALAQRMWLSTWR